MSDQENVITELKSEIEILKQKLLKYESQNAEKLSWENSEDIYTSLFIKNRAIKLLIDPDNGNICDASSAALDFYGYSLEEIKQLNINQINILNPEQISLEMEKVRSGVKSFFNFSHKLASGEIHEVEVFSSPVKLDNKKYLFSIVNDITPKLIAEKRLKELNKDLDQEKILRELVLSNTPEMFAMYDIKGRHLYANSMLCKAFNLELDQVLGKTIYEVTKVKKLSDLLLEKLNEAVNTASRVVFEAQTKSKENIEYWDISYSPVFDTDKKNIVQIVAYYRNITEIKKSLQEKEILLKELHHRVKNNLQVILSLLSLQSSVTKESNILSALQESQNRIKSIALVHEKLYQSENITKISFENYLKSLTENLLRVYGVSEYSIKVDFDIDKQINLNIDTIIVCGLIINELISNALKYAFESYAIEKLKYISLSFLKQDDFFLIKVQDNGVGLPEDWENKKNDSLGLQLVKLLVEQLDGELEIQSEEGCCFTIKFPSKN